MLESLSSFLEDQVAEAGFAWTYLLYPFQPHSDRASVLRKTSLFHAFQILK